VDFFHLTPESGYEALSSGYPYQQLWHIVRKPHQSKDERTAIDTNEHILVQKFPATLSAIEQ
jgi:hypothetical protein